MDAGASILVAVGGDLLDEQLDKLAALLEGFGRVALDFCEIVCELAEPSLRLRGGEPALLAGCHIGLDGGD